MQEQEGHAIKFSIRLDPQIYKALHQEALAQGRDVGDHTQRILTRHVIDAELLDPATGDDHEMRMRLVDHAIEFALTLKRNEGITRDFTNKVFEAGMADPTWMAAYAVYAKGDPFQHKNPRKASINKEIGFRIRRAIGGKVAMSSDGKPIKTPVAGSVIQSFTEMEPSGGKGSGE